MGFLLFGSSAMAFLSFLAAFFFSQTRRFADLRKTRLAIEELELRTVPSTTAVWIGPTGGSWSTAANWDTGVVPDSNTIVELGSTYSGNDNVSVIDTDSHVQEILSASTYGGFNVASGVALIVDNDFIAYGTSTVTGSAAGTSITAGSLLVEGGSMTFSSMPTGTRVTVSANTIIEATPATIVVSNVALTMTGGVIIGGSLNLGSLGNLTIAGGA